MNLRILVLSMITLTLTAFITSKPVDSNGQVKPYFDTNAIWRSIETFECNEFVWDALNEYTLDSMKQKYGSLLTCELEPVTNTYNPDIIDTVYSFTNDKNEIRFYKARENSFVFRFTVRDSIFKLTGKIHPGMTKNKFETIFNIPKRVKDTVIMNDSDDAVTILFIFDKNRLAQITSDIYFD